MNVSVTRRSFVAFGLSLGAPVFAQTSSSSRPLRIVVPYPAGGLSDVQARTIAPLMSETLGQPVIVENKAGASGVIGTQSIMNAAPDDPVVALVNNGLLTTPLMLSKPPFQPLKDFRAVGLISRQPMVLVVNKDVPADNLKQFIEWARKQPNAIEFASAGIGSYGHIASATFFQMTGLPALHIPYKGEAPMTLAVRSGEVKMVMTAPSPPMMNAVKDGQLKLLGVAGDRSPPWAPSATLIKDVVPGLVAEVWYGFVAPASMPAATVQRINHAMNKALMVPEIRDRFLSTGTQVVTVSPEELSESLVRESRQWETTLPKLNIRLD